MQLLPDLETSNIQTKSNSEYEMQNFNWQVVERLLIILHESGPLKKSQITMKSGLNYNSCMRYLKWLYNKMGFIQFEIGSDLKQIKSIRLTSEGILFCKNRILASKILEKERQSIKKNEKLLFV